MIPIFVFLSYKDLLGFIFHTGTQQPNLGTRFSVFVPTK
jgi:hypothetical protein